MGITATLQGTIGRTTTSYTRSVVARIATASKESEFEQGFTTVVRKSALDGTPDTPLPISVPLGQINNATMIYVRVVDSAQIKLTTETADVAYANQDTGEDTDGVSTGPFGFTLANAPVRETSVRIALPSSAAATAIVDEDSNVSGVGLAGAVGPFAYTVGSRPIIPTTVSITVPDTPTDVVAEDSGVDTNGASTGPFTFTLANLPIPNTVSVTLPDSAGGSQTLTDDGNGVLSGGELTSGTVDYVTGDINLTTFSTAPLTGDILTDYSYDPGTTQTITDDGLGVLSGGDLTTGTINYITGTAVMTFSQEPSPGNFLTSYSYNSGVLQEITDDGLGNLVGGELTAGTIDYATGVVSLTTFAAAPLAGDITADYAMAGTAQVQTLLLGTSDHPEGLYLLMGANKLDAIDIEDVFADKTEIEVWLAGNS